MPRTRKKPTSQVWDTAQDQAQRIHKHDLQALEQSEHDRNQIALLPLQKIIDRQEDTRSLREDHILQLAESIAVLGLLEPLVVDVRGRLLAGGHRKAAILWLKGNKLESYSSHFIEDMIPVRVMPFDSSEDSERALQIEVAENEHRRDYTANEVKALAKRLRVAGYTDTPGRPKKGEKRLRPALEVIVGKSLRSVRRYLTENDDKKPVQFGQVSKMNALKSAKRSLERLSEHLSADQSTSEKQLLERIPRMLKLIEKTKNIESENNQ